MTPRENIRAELDALKGLHETATKAPWSIGVDSDGWDGETTSINGAGGKFVVCGWGYDARWLMWGQSNTAEAKDDAELPDAKAIVALRNAAPWLIELAERGLEERCWRCADKGEDFACPSCTPRLSRVASLMENAK